MLEILREFQGIIGAILGVISTMVVTFIFKKIGKVYIQMKDIKIQPYIEGAYGDMTPTNEYKEAIYADVRVRISLFNSSDEPRGLMDIFLLCLDKKKKEIIRLILTDLSTSRPYAGQSKSDEIQIINLPIKTMVHYNTEAYIGLDDVKAMENCLYIRLEAIDHRGKKIKSDLLSIDAPLQDGTIR